MESNIKERMEDIYVRALNDNFVYDNVCNLEMFLKDFISFIGVLLIEFLGLKFVIDGKLTLGNVLTFTFLANYFIGTSANILELSKEYFYAKNAIDRVNNLFLIEDEDLNTRTNYDVLGNLKFENLRFSYNGEYDVLKGINLEIKKGERVIILGTSGSGKSTFFKLLLKYYQVNRGSIIVDGVDINDCSILNLRENICCISQSEFIYTDTIRNNITMYQNVNDKDFSNICKIVCLDEFVMKMFLGYDTKLEENGVNLSGGQRQRIILARMLLQNKRVMLIDEGLNAIDVELERKILRNIFEFYKDRTIIVVSHRRENLDLFNQIVEFENGKVGEFVRRSSGEILYD